MPTKIQLFLTDMDGVLTDGLIYYTHDGEFAKGFHVHDGVGMLRVRAAGIKTGIITSERSAVVERRAERLQVDFLCMGKEMGQKLPAAKEICQQLNLGMEQVAYMGDDLNCRDLLQQVGYPACPRNAQHEIKAIAGIYQTKLCGGEGALREWINYLFAQDLFDRAQK